MCIEQTECKQSSLSVHHSSTTAKAGSNCCGKLHCNYKSCCCCYCYCYYYCYSWLLCQSCAAAAVNLSTLLRVARSM
eukprot:11641-Heterococcus_DN1.PRE.2